VAPPQTERPSSSTLESSLRQKMAAEPMLKNAKLDVRVTDRDIVVSGTVDDRRQHDVAMQVVQSNAGDRQVVDKIKERS
jgi:osmotically-inducible protein OsmY